MVAVDRSVAEDRVSSLGDYADAFRRHWVWFAVIIPGALLIAIFFAYYVEPQYEATGTIMLEESSIPQEVISTTVVSYADQLIEVIRGKVLTSDRLKELVAQVDPFPGDELTPGEKAYLVAANTEIERVDPVTRKPVPTSNAFTIHYTNPNPYVAKVVCDKLVNLFLTYNQRTRTEIAAGTSEFLKAQAAQIEEELKQAEARLQAFRTKYPLSMPEDQIRNQLTLDRLQRDADDYKRQIAEAQTKEAELSLQLSQTNPSLYDPRGDWQKELAQLRSDLAIAQQKYTQDHPDVKRLKRSIEALSARNAVNAQNIVPDNPEYQSLSAQLQAVRTNLATLKSAAVRTAQQLEQIEVSLSLAPTTDREYDNLSRNRQMAQTKYEEIQKKLQEAQMAEKFETEQRGERLTLLQSPSVPRWPSSPNRVGAMLLGLVLGVGVACAIVAFLESSDPTVRGRRDLQQIINVAMIGAVPVMYNGEDRKRRLVVWGVATVVFAIATLITIFTVIGAQQRAEAVEAQAQEAQASS